jgi:hypothetical protein
MALGKRPKLLGFQVLTATKMKMAIITNCSSHSFSRVTFHSAKPLWSKCSFFNLGTTSWTKSIL